MSGVYVAEQRFLRISGGIEALLKVQNFTFFLLALVIGRVGT